MHGFCGGTNGNYSCTIDSKASSLSGITPVNAEPGISELVAHVKLELTTGIVELVGFRWHTEINPNRSNR
jgi:hypothetical protein